MHFSWKNEYPNAELQCILISVPNVFFLQAPEFSGW